MPDAPTGPWLSIITVVKDDPEGFARTAESIAGQNLKGVEWVVIDGSGKLDPTGHRGGNVTTSTFFWWG